ncbi:glycogen synthase [Patescibacteria group bacterium]|nr:glycogen synthase [Patescibacteria group bacterium]
MTKKLKIAVVAAEVAPFSKTGGLADVTGSLPKTFHEMGNEVVVITPFYGKLIDPKKYSLTLLEKNFSISAGKNQKVKISLWRGEIEKNLPIYFIEYKKYFSKKQSLYGSTRENSRFALFNYAALEVLKKINFEPDIIQCHDWHAGLIPYLLKKDPTYTEDKFFNKTATVFTIHNLAFQMGGNWWSLAPEKRDSGTAPLPKIHTQAMEKINFAKRAIIFSDALNTVSEKYAEELLTPEFGQGLEKNLQHRQKDFFGIINGIDYSVFNPTIDKNISVNYDWNSLRRKKKNKVFLQKNLKLEENTNIPLIGLASRLAEQKGYNLVIEGLDTLLKLPLQIVIIASGGKEAKEYSDTFKKIAKKYSKKFAFITPYTEEEASKVYAGSDMLLMPSRFEPCGLSPLISLRYGSIPIVHETGGLAETITDFDPKTGKGNGFVFENYTREEFLVSLVRALENFKYEKIWEHLVWQAMKQSFSWEIPGKKYLALFKKALKNRRNA